MKTITELTKEELELVQAAREKKEKEEIERAKFIQDRIFLKKQSAEDHRKENMKQVLATHQLFQDFKNQKDFKVVVVSLPQTIKVHDGVLGCVVFEETYFIKNAYITHKIFGGKIVIKLQTQNYKSGYALYLDSLPYPQCNRAYKKATTAESRFVEFYENKAIKQNRNEIRETFITELIETQPIPNAVIEKEYISSNYIEYKYGVRINYNNGVKATCSIDIKNDIASLSIYKTEYPKPKIEGETTMDKLKYISELKF